MHELTPLTGPVSPVEALRRIATLIERQRAGSYRIEAFRSAMATLAALDEDEVASRASAGTLTDLDGVGASTAAIVEQAVAGDLPDRLQKLQDETARPLAEGGDDLFDAIVGDCHSHSTWSDGGSPIEEMVLTAAELGQDWLVLTDHSPRLKVANGLSAERLARFGDRAHLVHTVYDRMHLVEATVATVEKNLVEGALLVIVVNFCVDLLYAKLDPRIAADR